ncbi:MAG: response regulator [Lachnospiraceae bacterium]
MYRVLIADDEISVVEMLMTSIPWAELGLEVTGIAHDGNQAVAMIENNEIDIAILDIRMPGLNGLEVCEKLHKVKEALQIIIISGYAEFSYAQRALQYGVLGYCLKPIEYDQMNRLLLKAENNCAKNSQRPYEIEFLEALERKDEEVIQNTLTRAGMAKDWIYVAVSVGEQKLPLEKENAIIVELGREQYGYIFEGSIPDTLFHYYAQKAGVLGVGYTSEAVEVIQIPDVLSECLTKAFQYFVEPDTQVWCNLNTQNASRHLERIMGWISKNKWNEVQNELQIMEKEHSSDFTIRSALKLCNLVHSGNLFKEEENDFYVYSLRQLASQYHDIKEMLQCLRQDVKEAEEELRSTVKYTNSAFLKLMVYISENYNKDISLSSVAHNCHMSSNYVSQLFKKETGTTFVHYVTKLRMDEAIKLLQTTRKSTAEISTMVGFNDYFYFLKTFKKYTGKTLGQFRADI